jgi:SOS response regulatory protein OraA/RecX
MSDRPSRHHPPATVQAACALAMGWLAGRDLSAAEIRRRLHRQGCPDDVIKRAIEYLKGMRAIDDERVAMSRARIESASRGRGRARVLLRLRSIGIDAETARKAVDAVFEEVDETGLLDRALERRLKGVEGIIRTPAEFRRVYDALLRQGFPPSDVRRALDRRMRHPGLWHDVDDEPHEP